MKQEGLPTPADIQVEILQSIPHITELGIRCPLACISAGVGNLPCFITLLCDWLNSNLYLFVYFSGT